MVTLAYRRELQKIQQVKIKRYTYIRETNCAIHWIDICPADGVILHFNNWLGQ